jgi:hypothetical protein
VVPTPTSNVWSITLERPTTKQTVLNLILAACLWGSKLLDCKQASKAMDMAHRALVDLGKYVSKDILERMDEQDEH